MPASTVINASRRAATASIAGSRIADAENALPLDLTTTERQAQVPTMRSAHRTGQRPEQRAMSPQTSSSPTRRTSTAITDQFHVAKQDGQIEHSAASRGGEACPSQVANPRHNSLASTHSFDLVGDVQLRESPQPARILTTMDIPTTFMRAADSTSTARTTMEALSMSGGQSVTFHQGPNARRGAANQVHYSQPLHNNVALPQELGLSNHSMVNSNNEVIALHRSRPPALTEPSGSDLWGHPAPRQDADVLKPLASKPKTRLGARKCDTTSQGLKTAKSLNRISTSRNTGQWKTVDDSGPAETVLTTDSMFSGIENVVADELIELTESVEENLTSRRSTPPPRERKRNIREVDEHETYGGALLSTPERQLLSRLRSQIKATTTMRPVVRQPFPSPVLDRSLIFGASKDMLLRTCFRVGEALNIGCQAVRHNQTVLVELYARVSAWQQVNAGDNGGDQIVHSLRRRIPHRWHFVLKDLYHDKPPHLRAYYDLNASSALAMLDCEPFLALGSEGGGEAGLQEELMARVVGRMRRDGTKWVFHTLSIWHADWDDVKHVAGIYACAAK